MIGSLLYVIASGPNVKQAVGMVARFQAAPKESHVQAVKRIFRYLKGTIDLVLWYPSKDSFTLKSPFSLPLTTYPLPPPPLSKPPNHYSIPPSRSDVTLHYHASDVTLHYPSLHVTLTRSMKSLSKWWASISMLY
jgi:hypothetical protein